MRRRGLIGEVVEIVLMELLFRVDPLFNELN